MAAALLHVENPIFRLPFRRGRVYCRRRGGTSPPPNLEPKMKADRNDPRLVAIANVILEIVDGEKRYVVTGDCEGDVEELRMQLREVAFALAQGVELSPDMLT